jgi:hypothetical protein
MSRLFPQFIVNDEGRILLEYALQGLFSCSGSDVRAGIYDSFKMENVLVVLRNKEISP